MDKVKILNTIFVVSFIIVGLGFFLRLTLYPISGVPVDLDSAPELIQDYEDGKYYANSHGDYTTISYEAWRFHTVVWDISIPFIVIGLVAKVGSAVTKSFRSENISKQS